MPITGYRQYFFDHIRGQTSAVFHSGSIFSADYAVVRAVTFSRTDDPVTVEDRLIPAEQTYQLNRLARWIETEWPSGKLIQRRPVDPIDSDGGRFSWRNYYA